MEPSSDDTLHDFEECGLMTRREFDNLCAHRRLETVLTRLRTAVTWSHSELGRAQPIEIEEKLTIALIETRRALANYLLAHTPPQHREAVAEGVGGSRPVRSEPREREDKT
jgi:hypothetical protein